MIKKENYRFILFRKCCS